MTETIDQSAIPAVNEQGYRFIGTPMPIVEDRRFVRGRGRYIADLELPNMMHMGVLSAPVAHARIISINIEAAQKAPGVIYVLTGEECAKHMDPVPQDIPTPTIVWYPLAHEKIRYVGEWVVAIVATSRAAAEDACELVELELEELPPLTDPIEAAKPDAPILHEAHGSNILKHNIWHWGEVEESFEKADHVFEYAYRWHRHSGVPLETFGVVADFDKQTEQINIWASHQNPGLQQEAIEVLRSRARVHMDIDVGGSYGSKRGQKHMYLTGVLAMLTGYPVKFIEDRTENMQAGDGHGPDRRYTVKIGLQNDGTILAFDIRFYEDLGAYSGRGPKQMVKSTTAPTGPYKVDNVHFETIGVLTCKTNQVPFRGSGQSPHNYALERALDHAARDMGMDPVAIRLKNFIQPEDFPWFSPSNSLYDSGDYPGAMALAMEKAGYDELRKMQLEARKEGRLIGIGLAGGVEPGGASGESHEGARIEVDKRGRVTVTIGFQSAGQAHESMCTMIVCEELSVIPKDVLVLRGNGLSGIIGGAPTGSRMTLRLGLALKGVSDKVNDKMKLIAAHALEAPVEDITIDAGNFYVAGVPSTSISFKEIANKAYGDASERPQDMEPGICEDIVIKGPEFPEHDEKSTRSFPSYAFDFHIPVIEIDPDTCQIKFLKYVVVHDCGTQMNPLVVDGFVFGGIGHGIGGAMYEDFHYDPESGQLVATSFMDYLMPTATEIPYVDLHAMVTKAPGHPYGAKGTAEGAYMTAPAAVASAVEDAVAHLGIRFDEVPITPQLIFDLMQKHKSQ